MAELKWDRKPRKPSDYHGGFTKNERKKQKELLDSVKTEHLLDGALKIFIEIQEKFIEDGWVHPHQIMKLKQYKELSENISKKRGEKILKNENKTPQDELSKFYDSYEWARVRYEILKRDNRRCACCNVTPEDGAVVNVDHIKPLRFNWHLRLDPDNLQVLCSVCSHGKENNYKDN